jgi:hypothetical protein
MIEVAGSPGLVASMPRQPTEVGAEEVPFSERVPPVMLRMPPLLQQAPSSDHSPSLRTLGCATKQGSHSCRPGALARCSHDKDS